MPGRMIDNQPALAARLTYRRFDQNAGIPGTLANAGSGEALDNLGRPRAHPVQEVENTNHRIGVADRLSLERC